MIVPTTFWTGNIQQMKKESHNYLVLDTEHLQYAKDEEPFELGIHTWNLINSLRMANNLYKSFNTDERFNTDILYEVLKAIEREESFTITQLKAYFDLLRKIEKFARDMQSFYQGTEYMYGITDIDMILSGFSLKKQADFKRINDHKYGYLHDEMFDLKDDVINRKMTVEEYSKKARETCEEALKEKCELNP